MWLMNRFAVDSSLTGDLTEEWATGHSISWLLRQTCIAITSSLWAGVWHHKLRTIAAVATGWIGWNLLFSIFVYGIYAAGYPRFPVGLLLFILRPILLGWIVGKLQGTQPLGTALLFIASFIIVGIVNSWHNLLSDGGALLIMSWLILTTAVGGLVAVRKPKCFPIPD
jgi:hypothetical protein